MAGRRSTVTDIREIVRRVQLGEPDRRIARDLGVSRNTVAHYRLWAERHGLLTGPLPEPGVLARSCSPRLKTARPTSSRSSSRSASRCWSCTRAASRARRSGSCCEQHGFGGSYSLVKRFLRRQAPSATCASIRVEVVPGEEAQVDFGYAGPFLDPELGRVRRAWVFVMVLSCSRHQYAELVFDQTVATWLRLHRAAFEFFGGVPRRVVLDYVSRHITN
jgi:transposase